MGIIATSGVTAGSPAQREESGLSVTDPEQPTPALPARVLLPVDDPRVGIPELRGSQRSFVREIAETLLITVLLFVMVQSVIQTRWVDGESMLPTLQPHERLVIDSISYLQWSSTPLGGLFASAADTQPAPYVFGSGPQRGDIVVLHPPVEPPGSTPYIKRVIGLAGETVQVKALDGVYIDGVRLSEPYIKDTPDYNYGPLTVPAGDVFVLGDNRRDSSDSHLWGPLEISQIAGKAWLSYWPTDLWGLLPHPSYAAMQQPQH